MERKLIQQGRSGLTVYLPKQWLDARMLRNGDVVTITDVENALIITGSATHEQAITVQIDATNKPHLKHILTHLYRRGFDRITLDGADDGWVRQAAKITTQVLLGCEVTKQDRSGCVIASISEPSAEQYLPLVRRAFLIIKESLRLLQDAIRSGVYDTRVSDLMEQQERVIFFCKRVLAKGAHVGMSASLQWELLSFLLYIEHQVTYCYAYCQQKKYVGKGQVLQLVRELLAYFDVYYTSYYEKDVAGIYALYAKKNDLYFGRSIALLEQVKGRDAVVVSYVREILRWINLGSSGVFSELFDRSLAPSAHTRADRPR